MLIESNVLKIKWIRFLTNFLLPTPVVVLFWLANGLSLTQVMLLQSWFAVIIVLLEVPTGYFADKYGRKKSIVLANVLLFIGIVVYSLGKNFAEFMIAETLWGIGVAFISGADSAIVYESLKETGRAGFYKKEWGSITGATYIAALISNILGGFIGKIDLRLTFFASIPFFLFSLIISFFLKEPRFHRRIVKKSYSRIFVKTLRIHLIKNPKLRGIIIYAAILTALTQSVFWLYQPYFKLSGIDVIYFGIIFALFNAVAAISSKYAYVFEKKFGNVTFIILPAILSMSYFLMALFVFPLAFVFAFVQQIIRGILPVITTDYINTLTPSKVRATILSIQSFLSKLIYATLIPIVGYVADVFTLVQALLFLAGLTVTLGALSVLILYKSETV